MNTRKEQLLLYANNTIMRTMMASWITLLLVMVFLPQGASGREEPAPPEVNSSSSMPLPSGVINAAQERQEQVIKIYQQHRQMFLQQKKTITDEVMQEQDKLYNEINDLEQEIRKGEQHLAKGNQFQHPIIPPYLQGELRKTDQELTKWRNILSYLPYIHGSLAVFLSPWALLAISHSSLLLSIFLPLTVFNIFLFLYFRQKNSFQQHKKWLIIILVTTILASATSLMAAPIDKRLQVETRLRYAEDMLTLTGTQKGLRILEGKATKNLSIPAELSSGDPSLTIFKNVVVNTPEYFITLAALYTAENQTGKAIEALTNIAEIKGLVGTPTAKILTGTIRFLVEHNHTDIAGNAVTNHIASISNTGNLLQIASYLKKHEMPVSSDFVLETVLKRAKKTSELVALADYFYKTEKTDKAKELLVKALNSARSISSINLVAQHCIQQNAPEILSQIPAHTPNLRGTPEELVTLAKIFNEHGESKNVAKYLSLAIAGSTNIPTLKQVTRAVLEFRQGPLMDQVRSKITNLTPDLARNVDDDKYKESRDASLDFVDFLLSLERKEDAARLFEAIFHKIKKEGNVSLSYRAEMIALSQQAVQRNLMKQAENIIFNLTMSFKPRNTAFTTFFPFQKEILASMHGLPDMQNLSIPLYQGLLDEEINQLSKAEFVYMHSVRGVLDNINNSYGLSTPDNLNDFFLLGRIWQKENRYETLASLDRVYTLLENRLLEKMKEHERQRLFKKPLEKLHALQKKREKQLKIITEQNAKLESKKALLEQQRQELIEQAEQQLVEKQTRLAGLKNKGLLKSGATLLLIGIVLTILGVCLNLAWQYSQRMKEHKVYGFITRFLELNGWIRVFSVIGTLSGLLLIMGSQFFQIFHKLHELSLQKIPAPSYSTTASEVESNEN